MKKELKSGILSADKSADGRPTVGGVNVIAVLGSTGGGVKGSNERMNQDRVQILH